MDYLLEEVARSPRDCSIFGSASVVDQSVPPSPLTSAASTSGISDTDAEGSVRDFPADLSDTESVVSGVPSDRSVHTTASQREARVLIERHIDLADQSVLSGSCLYHDLTRQEDNLLWSYKGLSIVMGHDGGVVVSGTFQDKDSALSISGSSVRLVDTILSRLSVKRLIFILLGRRRFNICPLKGIC
jgi:hypothetical protein